MTNEEFQRLATHYLENAIDEAELASLNRELAASPARVRQFNDLRLLAGLIHEYGRGEADACEAAATSPDSQRVGRPSAWTSEIVPGSAAGSSMPDDQSLSTETATKPMWRIVINTAAIILIGLVIGVPLGWAYAIPWLNQSPRESKEIVFESFEDPEMNSPRRFPTSANRWFGGMRSVPGTGGMSAVEGIRVGKFANMPEHRFSDARYVVDLDEYGEPSDNRTRSIEVSGSFFSPDQDHTSVFRIDVAAFGEAPEAVPPVWFDREHRNDVVLQRVARNFNPEPGDQPTWHEVKVTMEIPPEARSLVVSLSAGKRAPGGAGSDRYLDAVRVQLVDTIEPLD